MISEENLKKRLSEVSKVESIIKEELEIFKHILNQQRVERLVSLIYTHGYRVMDEEKNRALRYLERGRDQKEVLDGFSQAVLAKTLHIPSKILRKYIDVNFVEFIILQFEKEFATPDGSEAQETKQKEDK